MKKFFLIFSFLFVANVYGQVTLSSAFWVTKYKLKLGTRDTSVIIWYDRTTAKLKLIRPLVPDTVEFGYSTLDTAANYHWIGIHTFGKRTIFEDDSLKINGLWYDFPSSRFVGSIPYDSLGNGVLVWRHSPSFKDKAETFTGVKTFNADLIFGAAADLTLPTADPTGDVGKLWRDTNVLKFTNSGGTANSLPYGTGTTNELAYWAGTNSLGTLATATYPSLTELSYVKGVTSGIQSQINAKGSGTVTSIAVTSPLTGGTITSTGTIGIAGLSSYGADGQLIRVNSGATAWEYFTPSYITLSSLSGTSPISYNSGTGAISFLFNTNNTWTGTQDFQSATFRLGVSQTTSGILGFYNSTYATLVNLKATRGTNTRNIELPDSSGTVALLSNIPSTALFVPTSRTISTTSPLSGGGDLSGNRTISLAGLSSYGADGQLLRVNSGATAWEYFTPTYAPVGSDNTFSGNNTYSGAMYLTAEVNESITSSQSINISGKNAMFLTLDNAWTVTLNSAVNGQVLFITNSPGSSGVLTINPGGYTIDTGKSRFLRYRSTGTTWYATN